MSWPTLRRKTTIRSRLMLFSLMGLVVMAAIFGANGYLSIREATDRAFQERLVLAEVIGNHIDTIMQDNLSQLTSFAFQKGVDLGDDDFARERAALKTIYLTSIFTEGVFLQDIHGKTLITEPSQFDAGKYPWFYADKTHAIVSEAMPTGMADKMLILVRVPISRPDGKPFGIVGGAIDPTSKKFQNLIQSSHFSPSRSIDLVDASGRVILSTHPERVLKGSDHRRYIADLIVRKSEVISKCHTCHDEAGRQTQRDIIAFTPLKLVPWGVVVRQPEAEALKPARVMRNRLAISAIALVLAGIAFALGIAQSVTRPMRRLQEDARRIADGDLSNPIPNLGGDEMGALAQSFEKMRQHLQSWNQELEAKINDRTEELRAKQNRVSALLQQVIMAQEAERMRIARELHDEISQNLILFLLKLDTLNNKEGEVDQIRKLANHILTEIHRIIRDLRPSVLDNLGLMSAIKWLADTHLTQNGIEVSLSLDDDGKRFPVTIETTLFRIIQEAINNIYKHAQAKNVRIECSANARSITVEVEDDGIGFDPDKDVNLGIAGMKERIALINGTIRFRSSKNVGTTITIEVPIHG